MDNSNSRSPSELAHSEQVRQHEQAIHDVRRIADTPEGARFLRWLAKSCGVGKDLLVLNRQTLEVNTTALIHDVARRRVWEQTVAPMLTDEQRFNIEIKKPIKEAKPDVEINSINEVE